MVVSKNFFIKRCDAIVSCFRQIKKNAFIIIVHIMFSARYYTMPYTQSAILVKI